MQVELRLLASMRRLLPENDRARGFTVFNLQDGATCKELLIRADVWGKSTLVVLVNGRYSGHGNDALAWGRNIRISAGSGRIA